ncbi:Athe_2463 domain-containing protein [Caldicellulosiruptoraceae bacterium PP1]
MTTQAGFKSVANGYFYATQTNGVWHLATSGTSGATRGYFRYLGYDVNGNVISDQQFPADLEGGYIPVTASTQLVSNPWNNATAKQICSVANGYNKPDS